MTMRSDITTDLFATGSYERNEAKIRSLVTTNISNNLLEYSTRIINSKNLDYTYVMHKIHPKRITRVDQETYNDILNILPILTELCKPTIPPNTPSKSPEEINLRDAIFTFACGFDMFKYSNESRFLANCNLFVRELKDYPPDVIAEGMRQYLLKFKNPPQVCMLVEIMNNQLFSKRFSLYESLSFILSNLKKNESLFPASAS